MSVLRERKACACWTDYLIVFSMATNVPLQSTAQAHSVLNDHFSYISEASCGYVADQVVCRQFFSVVTVPALPEP
jgi:hypothetical protein